MDEHASLDAARRAPGTEAFTLVEAVEATETARCACGPLGAPIGLTGRIANRTTPCILQRIAGGETAAVRECIDQYGALVWSLARRLSRTPADAEDATQEIFVQIWRQAGRFDCSLSSEQTFISMIARRRLIDRLRTAAAAPSMEPFVEKHEAVTWTEPHDFLETCEEASYALRVLQGMSLEHRQVIELGYLHGLSHPQIADRLGLPLGTVKSLMRRGLLRIRERLNRRHMRPAVASAPRAIATSRPPQRAAQAGSG